MRAASFSAIAPNSTQHCPGEKGEAEHLSQVIQQQKLMNPSSPKTE